MASLLPSSSIQMQHWRCPATDGTVSWISCQWPAFLNSFSPLQLISAPGTYSAAAYVTAGWFQGWMSLNLKGSRIVIVNSKSARWDITGVYALVVVVAKCPLPSQLSQLQLLAASQQKLATVLFCFFYSLNSTFVDTLKRGMHSSSKGGSRICSLV